MLKSYNVVQLSIGQERDTTVTNAGRFCSYRRALVFIHIFTPQAVTDWSNLHLVTFFYTFFDFFLKYLYKGEAGLFFSPGEKSKPIENLKLELNLEKETGLSLVCKTFFHNVEFAVHHH